MVLPEDIQPVNLGLTWHSSKELCLSALHQASVEQDVHYVTLDLLIKNDPHRVDLVFDGNSLTRIELILHESRDFWEGYTTEEMQGVSQEFKDKYMSLVGDYISRLGTPVFSGAWGEPRYPEGETAWLLTFWMFVVIAYRSNLISLIKNFLMLCGSCVIQKRLKRRSRTVLMCTQAALPYSWA